LNAALSSELTAIVQYMVIRDEEHHSLYLESQLGIIKEAGIENYLATQMDGDDAGH
jgi:bacterioferritin (cytochrome b1)